MYKHEVFYDYEKIDKTVNNLQESVLDVQKLRNKQIVSIPQAINCTLLKQ